MWNAQFVFFFACLPECVCLFLRAGMSVVYRAVCTSCSLTINGDARGLGVTCYSHNGKDLYCSKPAAGQCFTTGGWCPPDFGGDDEILPTEGVRAPPNPALVCVRARVLVSVCMRTRAFVDMLLGVEEEGGYTVGGWRRQR